MTADNGDQKGHRAAFYLFFFPTSDPYVKVTLYDPVNGALTSIQTKTIRKVSNLICVGVVGFIWGFWYCVEVFLKQTPEKKLKL